MADMIPLKAQVRSGAGKGVARQLRREGRLPAVVYGDRQDPLLVSVSGYDLFMAMNKYPFYTSVIELNVDGKKERVFARDVQVHPVTDDPEHADFLRVSAKTRLNVMVPVYFINEEASPGIERGGVLNIVRHEVEVSALALSIPEYFEIDIAGTEIGDSLHASAITLPDGVELTITDRDFTLATLTAPSALKSEEDEEAEGEEGEDGEEAEGADEAGEEGEGEES